MVPKGWEGQLACRNLVLQYNTESEIMDIEIKTGLLRSNNYNLNDLTYSEVIIIILMMLRITR
jgi:hypothetical protein